jgi:hypothetical protein
MTGPGLANNVIPAFWEQAKRAFALAASFTGDFD